MMDAPRKTSLNSGLFTRYQFPPSRPDDKHLKETTLEELDDDSPRDSQCGKGPRSTKRLSEDEKESASIEVHLRTEGPTPYLPTQAEASLTPHGIHWWSLIWAVVSFVFGLALCVGHHLFYSHLNGIVAGNAKEQEWHLRCV